jgi:hypothetical protein
MTGISESRAKTSFGSFRSNLLIRAIASLNFPIEGDRRRIGLLLLLDDDDVFDFMLRFFVT